MLSSRSRLQPHDPANNPCSNSGGITNHEMTMEPTPLLSVDELLDHAYEIFLELAADNLSPEQIECFNAEFEERGALGDSAPEANCTSRSVSVCSTKMKSLIVCSPACCCPAIRTIGSARSSGRVAESPTNHHSSISRINLLFRFGSPRVCCSQHLVCAAGSCSCTTWSLSKTTRSWVS